MIRHQFCEYFENSYMMISDWEYGKKRNPRYFLRLLEYYVKAELMNQAKEELYSGKKIYNPNFKVVEFDHFKMEAELPTFTMSVTDWVDSTGAIGIYVKRGKYGCIVLNANNF